ncbi:MAG: DUF1156 domain-containing protein [Chloroflexi bacterium]|nr:DUF1156 domain-containing protein [Chloroflexota bacterium]
MTYTRKLIEVTLPLEAINAASAREKSIRHGHPSTLHLWWARRPLAAARAVIFAQMVDDPSSHPERFPTEEAQDAERQRLFKLIEELVKWENTTDETVLAEARAEIWKSWRDTCAANQDHPRAAELFNPAKLPAFHDPFAGGGSIPLEAQRLGLEAYASDLNPVAVLINKAMIEIPPKFAGMPPVNPEARKEQRLIGRQWRGAEGLAEDVRYYGKWMRDEAEKRIGHLYPKVEITAEMAHERPDLKPLVGRKLTVIAWLWARTVKSPNPAFAHVDVPLASTFMLATKPGKEAYVEPVVEGDSYRFTVKKGKPSDPEAAKNGTKLARGANFRCVLSGSPITPDYIKSEGRAGRLGARLMAIVAKGDRARVYLPPTAAMEAVVRSAVPAWKPDVEFFQQALGFRVGNYGMTKWSDLFTSRQLVTLTTLSDLVQETRGQVGRDAGSVKAYGEAVSVYLALCVDKAADYNATLVSWNLSRDQAAHVFTKQALPMVWDYAEVNPFSEATGDILISINGISRIIGDFNLQNTGASHQANAEDQIFSQDCVISTDPPYYDNVGYSDLSDFFYVWMRNSLRSQFHDIIATVVTPKSEELVATPGRHGGKQQAEQFFLEGMTRAMSRLAKQCHPDFPVTIYYGFKQSENEGDDGTASTGWETFLDASIRAGFAITGTLPMRTERISRSRGIGSNALASSIVLVCRKRPDNAPMATRREFLNALGSELPEALRLLQRGNIAPVDLAQAAIGPGMAVYTRYAGVIDAEGNPLTVRQALALINQTLDEVLAEQEGDFDPDTRWALAWFDQYGFAEGEYGVAETLSKAKNTSVAGMVEAGIVESGRGRVRLLRPEELPPDWVPGADPRLTVWEIVHHLIRRLEAGGESAAANLMAQLGGRAEAARELGYRLYTLCERKKRAHEALSYNGLVQSWPEIVQLASEITPAELQQPTLGL